MYDCSSGREPGALCLDGVEHLGRDWTADFAFDQDRLAAVSLVRPFDPSLYLDAFAAITARAQPWWPCNPTRASWTLSGCWPRAWTTGNSRTRSPGSRNAACAPHGWPTCSWTSAPSPPLTGKAGDLATLTVWAGSGLVRTVLVLHGGNTGTNKEGDWLAVVFEAPNHTLTQ